MPSCLPLLLSDGSRQASLNGLPPLSAEDSKLVFLFPLYCGPFDSRGHALWLACAPVRHYAWHPTGIEEIFVK